MYDGIIAAKSGRGDGAIKATLKDPVFVPDMKLKDWVKVYGEDIVLSHFLASRKITVQKPMQAELDKEKPGTAEEKIAKAIEAGSAKAKDLKASGRTGVRKSQRKSRPEVEADFAAQGLDPTSPEVSAVIDGLFQK